MRFGNSASRLTWLLPLTALLASAGARAQEPSLDSRIEQTTSIIMQLDDLAETCLASLDSGEQDATGEPCARFLAAIDGEPVANYLSHCAVLKQWRDDFIADRSLGAPDAQTNLDRLAGIEQNCGEDALSKQTEFVVSAFDRVARPAQARISRGLVQQSRQDRFNRNNELQRGLLLQSVQQQRARSDAAIQQQWNEVELELLRQQIRRDQ